MVRVEVVIGVIGIAKAVEAKVEKVPVKTPKVTAAPAKPAAIEATVTPQSRKPSARKAARPAKSRTKAAAANPTETMAATPAPMGEA